MNAYQIGGLALLGTAVLPTPDDATVISPILQLAAGLALLIYGGMKK